MTLASTIEIDIEGRWDALRLLRRLCAGHQHAFLVQVAADQWVAHAEPVGSREQCINDALAAMEELRRAGYLSTASVRVEGRPYRDHSGDAPNKFVSGRSRR